MTDRRAFLMAAGATLVAARAGFSADPPRIRKAVKYGMIKPGSTPLEKFEVLKKCGFQGVELDSPMKIDRGEVVKARDATGIVVHGVVDSTHWGIRHSDPKPETRAQALKDLEGAIRDCKTYGGDTVLLVPGAVRDKQNENFDQVWERSTEQVKKAIPLATELDVKIAIEVVWNNFITTPEQLIKYVDQFHTPTVGAYFDCSNMLKYGVPSAEWIRRLGKRMLKFDFKGYSAAKAKEKGNDGAGFGVGIGEGDENWPEIVKALREVGYTGWATAEVGGGDEKWLTDVSQRMDRILELK
ncbi:MAG: sugar phosphate isomerase/epimerase [Gemmataceae bacterium]|nr:sugar phosphate isomerase/epimerase [Gemmataceae bacterium]